MAINPLLTAIIYDCYKLITVYCNKITFKIYLISIYEQRDTVGKSFLPVLTYLQVTRAKGVSLNSSVFCTVRRWWNFASLMRENYLSTRGFFTRMQNTKVMINAVFILYVYSLVCTTLCLLAKFMIKTRRKSMLRKYAPEQL